MQLYFAPLEGITTCTYRNAHATCFPGADAYFAPFIVPSDYERISRKTLRDVLPEENKTPDLKVQVLTKEAASFLKFEQKIKELSYEEVNINLGCPFERVVKKGRGAGFLQDPPALERFFEEIFSKTSLSVSVKTRTGFSKSDEMDKILEVYNKFPLSLLIVHPRARSDFYKGTPDMAVFGRVYENADLPLCYNGNISTVADYKTIETKFPRLHSVMIGRGAVENPALFREIKGGKPLATDELLLFTQTLAESYLSLLASETFTLHKLKEVWAYMIKHYPDEKRTAKAMHKANKLSDFMNVLTTLPAL